MSISRKLRRSGLILLSLVAAAVAGTPVPATAGPIDRYPVGAGADYYIDGEQVFPEGVAVDHSYVYATSKNNGAVYRGRIGSGRLELFLPGNVDGRVTATGIKVVRDRIVVAGAETGTVFIYTTHGALTAVYKVAADTRPTLVNDITIAPDGDAYVTDSYRPVLYRIPAAEIHAPATSTSRPLRIAAHLPDYLPGASNGNGLVATADNRHIVVNYFTAGTLYRVSRTTGEVRKVTMNSPLTCADGMQLRGRTLYSVCGLDNTVSTLRLDSRAEHARLVAQRTYEGADTPTTLAIEGDRLLVVDSQFDTFLFHAPQTSQTFRIANLPLHERS